jgi:RNA polymerase sigma-70 factor (family 1)
MSETLSTADILAFQAGDRVAYQKIYKHYYKPIYSFILLIVQNSAEADDIYQKTLLKLWQRRKKFSTAGAIKAFLLVTARNAGLDYLRSAEIKTRAHNEIHYLAQNEEPWKDLELPKEDIVQEIYSSAVRLPPKCGQVFHLIFIQGKKTKEIAKQLNISLSTVLSHKSNALKLIRNDLIKRKFFPGG